jgi:hypothetical protein
MGTTKPNQGNNAVKSNAEAGKTELVLELIAQVAHGIHT